jgi:hypothetical protein
MDKKSISFDKISLFVNSSIRRSGLTAGTKDRLLNDLCTKSPKSLTLFEINDEQSGHAFNRFIESNGAAELKELKLTGSFFTDYSIDAVFEHCKKLERLTVNCAQWRVYI